MYKYTCLNQNLTCVAVLLNLIFKVVDGANEMLIVILIYSAIFLIKFTHILMYIFVLFSFALSVSYNFILL